MQSVEFNAILQRNREGVRFFTIGRTRPVLRNPDASLTHAFLECHGDSGLSDRVKALSGFVNGSFKDHSPRSLKRHELIAKLFSRRVDLQHNDRAQKVAQARSRRSHRCRNCRWRRQGQRVRPAPTIVKTLPGYRRAATLRVCPHREGCVTAPAATDAPEVLREAETWQVWSCSGTRLRWRPGGVSAQAEGTDSIGQGVWICSPKAGEADVEVAQRGKARQVYA